MLLELCFDHTLSVCVCVCVELYYCKHEVIILLLVVISISCSLLLRPCPSLVSPHDHSYVWCLCYLLRPPVILHSHALYDVHLTINGLITFHLSVSLAFVVECVLLDAWWIHILYLMFDHYKYLELSKYLFVVDYRS